MTDLAGGFIAENAFSYSSPQDKLTGSLSVIAPFAYSLPNDRMSAKSTFAQNAIYLLRAWRTESAAYVTWTGDTPTTAYSGGGTLLGTAVIQVRLI